MIPVILCGGAGTRLWPLSRKSFPKQFVPLINGKSLLRLTLERVSRVGGAAADDVVCVTAEAHRFLVREAMEAAGTAGPIVLEPVARNTAAAMALASLHVQEKDGSDPLLLFCPSDHHIPDIPAFDRVVQQGLIPAESGAIVTFGITPGFPSTAYGYIRQGARRPDGSHRVGAFMEKPDAEKARDLLLGGDVLWNAGIFLLRASTLLGALGRYAPDILAACEQAMAGAHRESIAHRSGSDKKADAPSGWRAADGGDFIFVRPERGALEGCRSQSIDYAVMEKLVHPAPPDTEKCPGSCSEPSIKAGGEGLEMVVVPFSGQWSDVGNWNAVAELTPPDEQGNRIEGRGEALFSENTYIHAPHRPVAVLGARDLLIIDTPDALLVADVRRAEQVRDVLARLEKDGYAEATTHRRVARPWGWYDRVDVGERFQVKHIGVKPGASLSLQKHHHRAEHWIIIRGTAEVTHGEKTFLLSENQSTYTPIGEIHRLRNPGVIELELIEVQSGAYLGEDDIVRMEDHYGR
uniref:Mannose-1-phosphate guanylyltransferase (GDP) /mannose-6-phosphate isomerase, type 2 n=1 Tax=Candidatus Kentrum sp. DK TaxID=2126562 RepID=A0A450S6N7_9GAMM|nr:MAG: mannose-1-phosphate guanylyltransferase (GDP) /mannose-6-phosphate isomerase, type 2 [Candidatus Kentron sp. DK]VFJ66871.1 MAG: mannose-1-phosphate guanylyltransferase (GDP) /mannose-6-phosphate isomerase, type 2 [Candidatus Kentron sp. DK]